MGKIRGTNSSPGIYTQITDLQYSADSLGITTLGLVGETLKGPAFEPVAISSWSQFQDYFGGTSTELFKESKYPKYELPYIAKSYLSASDQLYVCRVLGLSGYNAGPAFVLKQNNKVVAVLRSKVADYTKPISSNPCVVSEDGPIFSVVSIEKEPYTPDTTTTPCGGGSGDQSDVRRFKLNINFKTTNADSEVVSESVVVSLIYGSRDYIYDVLGSSPISGNYPLFVESVYDTQVSDSGEVSIESINDTADDCGKASSYREMFRHAMTPWFVSEVKGKDVKKLFRLHTISDGSTANTQVKITIGNIKPDEGTFDLLVRDFMDTDAQQVVLESYKNVNLVPGNSKYLGLKMGTINGEYPLKSKYVMVEIAESEDVENSVPCGFMGYPMEQYISSESLVAKYNTVYDDNVRPNRQCFGINLKEVKDFDVDLLQYKGTYAYTKDAVLTNGFHLDCRTVGDGLTVDGENKCRFISLDSSKYQYPVITTEDDMELQESIYYTEPKLRKFTCCFYGGFDGWDIYREKRTNTNEYKSNKYKGSFFNVDTVSGSIESLALPAGFNASDYYAYLSGVMQFSNPDRVAINLFATPGIDIVNNTSLVTEIVDMIEDRKDTFYVITSPDKESGASDSVDEMYTPSEITDEIEDSGIDTYYASTYYPWVRFYDSSEARFVNLPVTKDVVRNMADVDNRKYPWYAPAGIERGTVDCTKARIFTKLSDENTIYDGRINPVKTFSVDGVKIWGNKTLYTGDTPMNRINTVRLVLYMRKLICQSVTSLIFEPNDTTLKTQFEGIVRPILQQIKNDRGITDFRLVVSQTAEQMDDHEISAQLYIKPTPTLEYIELDFIVTPQGVEWND